MKCEEISRFFSHFRDILESLSDISFSKNETVIKKIVLCTMIDTFANAMFNSEKKVGGKYIKVVKDNTTYEHWNKISIPQLHYKFKNNSEKLFDDLKAYTKNVLKNRKNYSIDIDPTVLKLEKKLPTFKSQIMSCSYISLFYTYRNILIHQMKEPGYPFENRVAEEPFYQSVDDLDTKERTFQLVYPIRFFIRICCECIINLEKGFLKEQISPYDSFAFDDSWLKSANYDKKGGKLKVKNTEPHI